MNWYHCQGCAVLRTTMNPWSSFMYTTTPPKPPLPFDNPAEARTGETP
jgi:hypothetical protein